MKTFILILVGLVVLAYGIMLLKRVFVPSKWSVIRMVSQEKNPETGELEKVTYTPYFQHVFTDEKTQHRVRVYATFGPERLGDRKAMGDYRDLVDRVLEAYFMNDSDAEMTVELMSFKYLDYIGLSEDLLNIPMAVPANSEILSPSVHDVTIPFAKEYDFELTYKLNGEVFTIKDTLKRMVSN